MNNIKKLEAELVKSNMKLKELNDNFIRDRLEHELFMIDGESFCRKLIIKSESQKNGCCSN